MTKAGPAVHRLNSLNHGAVVAALLAGHAVCAPFAFAQQPAPKATASPAQNNSDVLLKRLAAMRSKLADPAIPAADRAAAEREAIDVRVALADALPNDDLAATWLIDAAAGMVEPLARDGTQASVLMGIATPSQRDIARSTARRGLDLLTRAETAAGTTVERLQGQVLDPAHRGDAAAESQRVETRLAALVDVELTQRIPYHVGLCHALLAACDDDAGTRAEHVRAAVAALSDREIGSMTGEAARRVVLAAALLLEPRGLDELRNAAREQLDWVAQRAGQAWGGDAPDPGAAVGRLTATQARMGEILATRPPVSLDDARHEVERVAKENTGSGGAALLIAEAHARLILADPAKRLGSGAERASTASEIVLDAYRAMPDESDAQHAARERVRFAAYEKVAALAPGLATSPEAMSPEMALASAVVLSRRSAEKADADASAQAAVLLESLVIRGEPAVPAPLKADALWELASLKSRSEDPAQNIRAMEALFDLASTKSDKAGDAGGTRSGWGGRRAAKAVAAGVQLGRFVAAQDATKKDAALSQRLRRSYRPLLQMMLAQSPAEADAHETAETVSPDVWRAELASVVLSDALAVSKTPDHAAITLATLDEVMMLMKPVRDAEVLAQGGEATVQRAFDAVRAGVPTGEGDKGVSLREQIGIQERELAWRLDHADPVASVTRLRLAELLLDAGDKAALAHLPQLTDADGPRPGVDPLRFRLALARADRLDGKRDEAFQRLLAIAGELDRPVGVEGQAGYSPRPELFWASWCEMLEILALDNLRRGTPGGDEGEGDRSATIRLHIRNLQLIDPALGGSPWAKRIHAVEESL